MCVKCMLDKPIRAKSMCSSCYQLDWNERNPEKLKNILDRQKKKPNYKKRRREIVAAHRQRNLDQLREKDKKYKRYLRTKYPEKIRAINRKSWHKNKEKYWPRSRELSRKWAKENKERVREIYKLHYKNNKSYYVAKTAKRRARLCRAIPGWADLEKIKEFYKNRPKGYHVDHIIPLKGKTVSGLHVLNNLQYLSASANMKKGNKFEG